MCDKNNQTSDLFTLNIGIRQGDNISPLLFALFLNDLKDYLNKDASGLKTAAEAARHCEMNDCHIDVFLKLFVLLYADDTVVFSEDGDELQTHLDKMYEYCKIWNLHLNVKKMQSCYIFSGKS